MRSASELVESVLEEARSAQPDPEREEQRRLDEERRARQALAEAAADWLLMASAVRVAVKRG